MRFLHFKVNFGVVRPLLASFFILIFSFQIIPIKEIGKILFNNQIMEEEVCGGNSLLEDLHKNNLNVKKEGDPFKTNDNTEQALAVTYFGKIIDAALHAAERLPKYYVPDILTPPPNC